MCCTCSISAALVCVQALRDFWYITSNMGSVAEERVIAFPAWTQACEDVPHFLSVVNHIASYVHALTLHTCPPRELRTRKSELGAWRLALGAGQAEDQLFTCTDQK